MTRHDLNEPLISAYELASASLASLLRTLRAVEAAYDAGAHGIAPVKYPLSAAIEHTARAVNNILALHPISKDGMTKAVTEWRETPI